MYIYYPVVIFIDLTWKWQHPLTVLDLFSASYVLKAKIFNNVDASRIFSAMFDIWALQG